MEKIVDFRDFEVWKLAHELTLAVYRVTQKYPAGERYGLISQIRRAAVSVPANIAEGFTRHGKREKARFYNIAQGSLQEVKYYLILSKDLGYIESDAEYQSRVQSINKMLNRLIAVVLS
jgi:four helix bundle protein